MSGARRQFRYLSSTTLAMMMLVLKKITPEDRYIEGKNIREISHQKIAKIIQPVFQTSVSFLESSQNHFKDHLCALSSAGSVQKRAGDRKTGGRNHGIRGVAPIGKHNCLNYSSAILRLRVSVSRDLIMRPQVVLRDEPTSALDVSTQAQSLNMLMA